MLYLPTDHLVWDFWFAPRRDGEPWHLFYLRAPATLTDPEERHWQAEVGHAVSDDLHAWTDLGVALSPSSVPGWDDKAIWTGSIIEHEGGLLLVLYRPHAPRSRAANRARHVNRPDQMDPASRQPTARSEPSVVRIRR